MPHNVFHLGRLNGKSETHVGCGLRVHSSVLTFSPLLRARLGPPPCPRWVPRFGHSARTTEAWPLKESGPSKSEETQQNPGGCAGSAAGGIPGSPPPSPHLALPPASWLLGRSLTAKAENTNKYVTKIQTSLIGKSDKYEQPCCIKPYRIRS